MSSLSGAVGIADHFSPCIFWWTMPAIGLPAGTCILSSASSRSAPRRADRACCSCPRGSTACRRRSRRRWCRTCVSISYSFCSAQTVIAAVDQVLAVVAGVVPAAADVQAVVALRLLGAGDALVADVPGRAFVALRSGVRHLDRDAAALQVEERQRVVLEALVDVVADLERQALVLADLQLEALAGGVERREVDLLHLFARRLVVAERAWSCRWRAPCRPCRPAASRPAPPIWSPRSRSWRSRAGSRPGSRARPTRRAPAGSAPRTADRSARRRRCRPSAAVSRPAGRRIRSPARRCRRRRCRRTSAA